MSEIKDKLITAENLKNAYDDNKRAISELKGDLEYYKSNKKVLYFNWGFGVLDGVTGEVGSAKNRLITDFVKLNVGEMFNYKADSCCKFYVFAYDENKSYIGIEHGDIVGGEHSFRVNYPYYKFMIAEYSDETLSQLITPSISDAGKFIFWYNIKSVSEGVNEAKEYTDEAINNLGDLELKNNRVNNIDRNSDDDHYPTAKCVYDATTNLYNEISCSKNMKIAPNRIESSVIVNIFDSYELISGGIDGNSGTKFNSDKIKITNFIPVRNDSGEKLITSIDFDYGEPAPSGLAVAFFYDENKNYIKQQIIAETGDSKKTISIDNYPSAYYVIFQRRTDLVPDLCITAKIEKIVLDWLYIKDKDVNIEIELDCPNYLYLIKGEPLEIFKHGILKGLSCNEKLEDLFLVRINNVSYSYLLEYTDKFVFNVPQSYTDSVLGGTGLTDRPCFAVYDKYGNVLARKYFTIFVVDKNSVQNISRNICYFGDSLTAMGYRPKCFLDNMKYFGLTNTKLIGVNSGYGSGSSITNDENVRYTATGGYSWDNYVKDPALLPSGYPNNHIWYNDQIDFNHFMQLYGDSGNIDYAVVLLGWNDYDMKSIWKDYNNEGIYAIERKARTFINRLHEQYPNCKIIIENYHNQTTLPRNTHVNPNDRNKFIWELTTLYLTLESEFDYVYFVHSASQFDVYHGLGYSELNPNIRATGKERYVTDTVHPIEQGYYQYADAETRCLMFLMQNEE